MRLNQSHPLIYIKYFHCLIQIKQSYLLIQLNFSDFNVLPFNSTSKVEKMVPIIFRIILLFRPIPQAKYTRTEYPFITGSSVYVKPSWAQSLQIYLVITTFFADVVIIKKCSAVHCVTVDFKMMPVCLYFNTPSCRSKGFTI